MDMKSLKSGYLYIFIFIGCIGTQLSAQVDTATDASKKERKNLKNTLRFNLTNPMLFGANSIVFGYERTIGKHQSFSVNAGRADYPTASIISSTDYYVRNQTKRGINFSVDYRFYFKKENKYNSPHGVYLGPFYSYNFFERKNVWSINTATYQGDVTSDLSLQIHTVGVELGYQFVLWNRVALDLVLLGPGVASYTFKTKLSSTLSPDDKAALLEKLNEKLAELIPGYTLDLDDGEFKKTGSIKTYALGFRYIIHLGFRF
jgi:hypothetical protein